MSWVPADHPLAGLQASAALASGWPTLHVIRPDEASLLDARGVIESFLGPLPQADVIEPWDPDDPDDPWELRVDLPGLQPTQWLALFEALAALPGPAPLLVPGQRDGEREAWDQGWILADAVTVDGVVASRSTRSGGGVLVPDLQLGRPDEAVRGLEADLAASIHATGVPVSFGSDRGEDTAFPVVHRETGRFGVQLAFSAPEAGERAIREAILTAVGRVVHRRAHHPVLRLAPDIEWDHRQGLSLVTWIIGPAAPGLPGDALVEPGASPRPDRLRALLGGLDDLVESLEIHVVPRTPKDHDDVADAVGTLIAGSDLPWTGGRPRWLRRSSGPVFTPTWRAPTDSDPDTLSGAFAALLDLPGVEAVRLVPGEPAGLGEAWLQVRPSWHLAGARWFQRLRDAMTDRDQLPGLSDRRADARDKEISDVLADRVARAGGAQLVSEGQPFRPVTDAAARRGLEIRLDAQGRVDTPLRKALDALGWLERPDLCSIAWWGYRDGQPVAWLAYR